LHSIVRNHPFPIHAINYLADTINFLSCISSVRRTLMFLFSSLLPQFNLLNDFICIPMT
jgi:hypothetical protein